MTRSPRRKRRPLPRTTTQTSSRMSDLLVSAWLTGSQSPPETPRSIQATSSSKTPRCTMLTSRPKVSTKPRKPVPGKPTGIPSRKGQKVAHVARDRGLDPMLRENTVALRRVSSLLSRPPPRSFPAVAGPPPMCLRCIKSVPDVTACSRQTEYHACRRCNQLHKPCLQVRPNPKDAIASGSRELIAESRAIVRTFSRKIDQKGRWEKRQYGTDGPVVRSIEHLQAQTRRTHQLMLAR